MRDILLALFLFSAFPMILYRYHIGALIIGFISFMYPQSNVYGFALTMPWLDYFFMTTFASYMLWQGFKDYKHHYLITYVIFLYIFTCITTYNAFDVDMAYEKWVSFTKILVLAYLIFAMLNTERRINTFLKVFVLSIGFYGIKGGIFTLLTGGGYHVVGPPFSFFEDNNAMALTLTMTFPFMLYFISHADYKLERYFSIFCALSSAFAILGTQSRTGFIAITATFLYYTWHIKKLSKALLFIVPIGMVALFFMADTWSERMSTSTELETDGSFQGRVEMWKASYRIATDHPFLGGGFDVIYVPQVIAKYIPSDLEPLAIHSSYFQMIAEHGYLGLAIYLTMLYLIFHTARKFHKATRTPGKISKPAELSVALRAAIGGYMVMSLTLNMAFFDILYFLIAVTAVADLLYRKSENHVRNKMSKEALSIA